MLLFEHYQFASKALTQIFIEQIKESRTNIKSVQIKDHQNYIVLYQRINIEKIIQYNYNCVYCLSKLGIKYPKF